MSEERIEIHGQKVSENIWLCGDGVYRWTYELDMLKNPTILFTVWKVLGIAFGAVYLFTLIIDLIQRVVTSAADLWAASKVFVIIAAVLFVLSILAYMIVAGLYGWKYQVLFEMNETQVTHMQMPRQFKKAQAIGWLASFAGILAGKPYMAGLGVNTAAKNTMTSEFSSAEFIRIRRKRHTIHVDQLFDKNQIYAGDADFDFVEKFILERCTKAKIK